MAQGRPALALTDRRPATVRRPSPRDVHDLRAESDPDLVDVIRARIAATGRITFAEFMELALYHPEHGYYLGSRVRSAREGDFLTAAELHPVFGHVLAGQLSDMWELLERPARFTLREYGAGPGTLGLTILERLRADGSSMAGHVTYEPIEINAEHRATLVDRFAAAGLADRLGRLSGAAEAGSGREPIVGCVLANEFVDALPVHRVVGAEGDGGRRLREVFVTWQDDWFAEETGEPPTPALDTYFEQLGIQLAPGQRAEVNLAMAAWLDDVAADVERGYVLVIDYGHPADQLYSAARFGGTLRAYREHTAHDDPFRFVGRQDLTAHVDFTTLERWAAERGLVPLASATQADLLVAGGLEAILAHERERPELDAAAWVALRASIVRLLDPRALGGFRVLLLGRGVPMDRLPSGFREVASS